MKVSVCIGVFNGERFLPEQLASILQQLDADDEVVISDDLSTDGSRECIQKFQDHRIKIVSAPKLAGLIFNFENALHHATGDVIFLADQDDIWLPNKVQTMKSLLESYDLVVSDCEIIDADGNILHESFFKLKHVKKGVIANIIRNRYMGCCMAFRRKILDVALPFPKNIPMHDVWIAVLAELVGDTYFCPERLMQYRRHGNNATPTATKSRNSLTNKFNVRVNLVGALLRRYARYRFAK